MIILGESLISLMTADIGQLDLHINTLKISDLWKTDKDSTGPDIVQIMAILLTFILSYFIGRLYFDCQPMEGKIVENVEHHALGRPNKIYAKLYQAAHQILFFGLFGYGLGVKIVTSHLLEAERRWIDVILPGYSLVIIVISLNIIRVAHPFDINIPRRVWIQRIVVIVIMSIVPFGAMSINQGVLFSIIFGCIVMLIIFDIEGHHKVKQEKIETIEKWQSHFSLNMTPQYK